jgi:hypothetical protein
MQAVRHSQRTRILRTISETLERRRSQHFCPEASEGRIRVLVTSRSNRVTESNRDRGRAWWPIHAPVTHPPVTAACQNNRTLAEVVKLNDTAFKALFVAALSSGCEIECGFRG